MAKNETTTPAHSLLKPNQRIHRKPASMYSGGNRVNVLQCRSAIQYSLEKLTGACAVPFMSCLEIVSMRDRDLNIRVGEQQPNIFFDDDCCTLNTESRSLLQAHDENFPSQFAHDFKTVTNLNTHMKV